MDIGNRIKQRRLSLGITAEDLAYEIGKSRTTIYRYENGDIENIPTTVLEPLAEALRTTPSFLMGWDDDPEDYESLANEYGICPPNDYDGNIEDWIKAKQVTDEDYDQEIEHNSSDNYLYQDDTQAFTYTNTATPAEFEKLVKPYRSLDDSGRIHIDIVLDREVERTTQAKESADTIEHLQQQLAIRPIPKQT